MILGAKVQQKQIIVTVSVFAHVLVDIFPKAFATNDHEVFAVITGEPLHNPEA